MAPYRKTWLSRHQTVAWSVLYIGVSVFPFALGALMRYSAVGPSSETFSASDLAIGVAFLLFYVSQGVLTKERPLDNKDKYHEALTQAGVCLFFAFLLMALFGIITHDTAMMLELQNTSVQTALRRSQLCVYPISILGIGFSVMAQRSFRLRAGFP